jgi:glycosyltransferase involved in cell wall biosynthesis
MAVHNGQKFLREAVASILQQTFQDFEFIIIDDGSTDGSKAILADFAARDQRIRLLVRENRGLTVSLNEGIGLARGVYIARMDGDDVSLPHRFEKQVAFMEAHPECVVVGADVMMIDPEGDRLCRLNHHCDHDLIDRDCLLGNGTALSHPVILMRKSALDAINGYNPVIKTGQDLDLYLRLCEVGKASNLPEILLLWRQHPQSINRTRNATWAEIKVKAIGDAIRRRGIEPYLQRLFSENSFPGAEQFCDHCYALARRGGNYRCALKYFHHAILGRGPRLRDLRQVPVLCMGLVKQSIQALFGSSAGRR